MLTSVTICEAIHSNLNSCSTSFVPKRVDPVPIDLGHAYTHDFSVSYGIRPSRAYGNAYGGTERCVHRRRDEATPAGTLSTITAITFHACAALERRPVQRIVRRRSTVTPASGARMAQEGAA